jgi:hypothetical protein
MEFDSVIIYDNAVIRRACKPCAFQGRSRVSTVVVPTLQDLEVLYLRILDARYPTGKSIYALE